MQKKKGGKQQHKHTEKHLKYLYVCLFALIYVFYFYFKKLDIKPVTNNIRNTIYFLNQLYLTSIINNMFAFHTKLIIKHFIYFLI